MTDLMSQLPLSSELKSSKRLEDGEGQLDPSGGPWARQWGDHLGGGLGEGWDLPQSPELASYIRDIILGV